jgi:hypothetical protein
MAKHDGCADCGDESVPMLYSILAAKINPKTGKPDSPNKAVCPACARKYGVIVGGKS